MAAETVAQAVTDIRKKYPNMDGLKNEEDTKQYVIERILEDLGWNHRDPEEVKREFRVKLSNDRPDYALNPNLPTAVFIEAKNATEPLEKHEKQLLTYCVQHVVNLAVLTNGRTWWLYLPNHGWRQGEGRQWSKMRFSEIDITKGKPSEIQKDFERFLAKEKVASGEAVEAARSEICEQEVIAKARKEVVETWNTIVTTPSQDLIKLVAGLTASLSDVKPNKRQGLVKEFFQNHRGQFRASDFGHSRPKTATSSGNGRQNGTLASFTFKFKGNSHSVNSWKEVLVELCELIYVEKQDAFDQIMSVQGTNNLYFSRNPDDINKPELIGDSGIFAATASMGPARVKERCQMVLQEFGYPKDCLRIEQP